MDLGFLFWLFLIGIIVASLQDLKRREVDNWLNLFLLFSGFAFIFFKAYFDKDITIIFQASFALVILFIFMNLFYYGRVFAGGDAKLLFSMTAFFVGLTFFNTLTNIGLFLVFLMIAGSVYGLSFSFVLYLKNFDEVNKKMKKVTSNNLFKGSLVLGFVFLILTFFSRYFLIFTFVFLIMPLLYVFAKSLEGVSMIKSVSGKILREGDWLAKDIRVGNKIIRANWDGLTPNDIRLLKNKKEVTIKEGIPFVPAFLIAFLLYSFFRDFVLSFLLSLA